MSEQDNVAKLPVDEASQLRERLARARAQQREVEQKRNEAVELDTLRAEVEREERAASDMQKLAELEQEHGAKRLLALETSQGMIVVRRPNNMLYKRFRDQGDAKTKDLEKLVRPCILHPDLGRFDNMVDEEPALLDRCANAVVKLAGFRAKEVSGK